MVFGKRLSSATIENPVGTAFTLFFAAICVAWFAVWVRSYWWEDGFVVYASNHRYVEVGTAPGAIQIATGSKSRYSTWVHVVQSQEKVLRALASLGISYPSRISGRFYIASEIILIPIWFVILVFGVIAAMPRVRWLRRLGVRTLLLAATLIASGIATIVALSR